MSISDRTSPTLYLASQSPRRSLLLEQAGIPFIAIKPDLDDAHLTRSSVTASQWAAALAYLKARAGLAQLIELRGRSQPPATVLGADTFVVCDDAIIGKPLDLPDARNIIHQLADRQHEVITGVAIVEHPSLRSYMMVDKALVTVGHIPHNDIEDYLASGQWQGKAGAYNLSERLNAGWPIEYSGDPATIMGLPMQILSPWLKRYLHLSESQESSPRRS